MHVVRAGHSCAGYYAVLILTACSYAVKRTYAPSVHALAGVSTVIYCLANKRRRERWVNLNGQFAFFFLTSLAHSFASAKPTTISSKSSGMLANALWPMPPYSIYVEAQSRCKLLFGG